MFFPKLTLPTIVVPVQALESQPQFLLVILQILGELIEVQTSVLVLVSRGHDFLQELREFKYEGLFDFSSVGDGPSLSHKIKL